MIEQVILIVHVLAAVAIIALVLLQQGKGADAGASFGGGSSQTVLGVQGGGNALTQWTSILAAGFFITSLALAYYAKEQSRLGDDVIIDVPAIESVSEVVDSDVPVLTVPAEEVPVAPVTENDVPAE
ncbi:MAG: preprotein translocase subunit SecG [Sinobacterium sp.]|nr:preprotein translocase subunit SecG [Sinobacterium sp.]